MKNSYESHLKDVEQVRSGVWTLLLAKRLYDMNASSEQEFKNWVRKVSFHEHIRNPNAPWHPFFSQFGENNLVDIFNSGRFIRFEAGQTICNFREPAKEMYIVARGRVDVQISPDIVVTREAGEVIGEMAIIEPGSLHLNVEYAKRTAAMKAASEVTLFTMPYSEIIKVASRRITSRAYVGCPNWPLSHAHVLGLLRCRGTSCPYGLCCLSS